MSKKYWLLKTEPSTYSIHDLANESDMTTCWDGVRNYQARNFLRNEMSKGDEVLFYHSNANPPAIVGTATVSRPGYPDHTAFDKKNCHYDPKSTTDDPKWFMVDIRLKEIFEPPLTLPELRKIPALKNMELLRKGSRLSVQPVRSGEFQEIVTIANRQPAGRLSATHKK